MPISKEQRAELAGVAGEKRSRGPRIEANTVRFDGTKGELRMTQEDGTQVPVAFPAEFVILKKRNALKAYINDVSHFTSEYEYGSTIISLFRFENGKAKHVASGTPPQLRAQYPTLRGVQMCYALYKGELVKLEVKGASFTSFIDYTKTLQEEDLHSYEVVTQVTGVGDGKKGVVSYKFMEFAKRDLTDDEFVLVKEKLAEVTKDLYEIDRYYAEKKAEKMDGVDAPAPEDPLASEFTSQAADDVDAADIPF